MSTTPKRGRRPTTTMPAVFDSMDHCESVLGIPKRLQQWAKQNGCTAFSANSRVDARILIPFLFSEKRDDNSPDWNQRLAEYKAKREKIRLEKDEEQIADRPTIKRGALKIMATIFDRLERKFCYELPAGCVGKSESEIAAQSKGTIEGLRNELKTDFETLGVARGETA